MFDLKAWLKEGLISGYKSGEFSRPYVITTTVSYVSKGLLTEADAAEIDAACPEPVVPEPMPEGIPTEDKTV